MKQLDLTVVELDGRATPASFAVAQVLLAGYTGRDQAKVMEHIHELEQLGVAPPERVPAVYVVEPDLLTTDPTIQVNEQQTSGEAEFYLVPSSDGLLVGVGSDHTDRKHEAIDVAASKGMCPKVLSANVWRYADIQDHWDQLQLRAWVTDDGGRRLYQDGTLASFLTIDDLITEVHRAGFPDLRTAPPTTVVFGGTLPLIGPFAFSQRFETELFDPLLNRRLACGYDIRLHTVKGRTAA